MTWWLALIICCVIWVTVLLFVIWWQDTSVEVVEVKDSKEYNKWQLKLFIENIFVLIIFGWWILPLMLYFHWKDKNKSINEGQVWPY